MVRLIPHRQIFSRATSPQTEQVEHGHMAIATDALTMAVKRMSRAGNCYDNAMMESLWATLKKELVLTVTPSRTHADARAAIFEWIEVWYQRIRIHGSISYVSTEAFEATKMVGQVRQGCS
jgi:hypothetical protein